MRYIGKLNHIDSRKVLTAKIKNNMLNTVFIVLKGKPTTLSFGLSTACRGHGGHKWQWWRASKLCVGQLPGRFVFFSAFFPDWKCWKWCEKTQTKHATGSVLEFLSLRLQGFILTFQLWKIVLGEAFGGLLSSTDPAGTRRTTMRFATAKGKIRACHGWERSLTGKAHWDELRWTGGQFAVG